jgi:hypothetical protein
MTGRQRKSTPWDAILRAFGKRKRRPRKGGHPLPEPVEPDPRKPRSGGAEAALEFDD